MDVILRSEGVSEHHPAASWRLSLLGSWHLTRSQLSCELGFNGQRLCALLALRGALDRSYVAGLLWPTCSETHARGNLRATLCRLHRRNLGGLLASSNGVLSLNPTVSVDARVLVATAWAVLDGRSDVSQLEPLRILDGDDLLVGWYDDWVLVERQRFWHLRLHALEALSAQLVARGNAPAAVEAGLAAVALDPLRESAHRAVISSHLAEGNLVEALRQFDHLRKLLRQELGVEPSPLAADLFR